jgi:hypothetical protein
VSEGVLTVVGKKNVVAAKLKKKVREFKELTSFFSFHCIFHQEV